MSKYKVEKNKWFNKWVAGAVIGLIIVSVGISVAIAGSSSLGGYQSITGSWYKIRWENPQGLNPNKVFQKSISGTKSFIWDADEIAPYSDGWSDMNRYSGTIENPKFDRNIGYHGWWINDTVSESNPSGLAKLYEWSIDIYTCHVSFRCDAGDVGAVGVEIWAQFQNNVDSVFQNLGAEKAASYVIYAQTEDYTWQPSSQDHHIILPTTEDYELVFLDTGTAVPDAPESGSALDFARLTPYSHVAIKFLFSDFGKAAVDDTVVVDMFLELNVLTVGRFDYVLTYTAGGDTDISPVGGLGLFGNIAEALAAGYSALLDGAGDLLGDATLPLIIIAVIFGIGFMVIIIVKVWM